MSYVSKSARKAAITLAAVASAAMVQTSHAAITNLVSFGDSLSDAGNSSTATGGAYPGPLYPGTNVTNGDVWQQYLANDLGFSHTASLLGGGGYAWGGARSSIDNDPTILPLSTNVQSQVDTYLTSVNGSADPDTLYTIWSGANDALYAKATGDFTAVGSAALDIASMTQQLLDAGASKVLVLNLPNVGLTPLQNSDPIAAGQGTFVSDSFNAALGQAMASVTGNFSVYDISGFTDDAVNNPGNYGLTNVTDRCLNINYDLLGNYSGHTTCSNPEEYLFWDDLHPTTAGHALIADSIAATVTALDNASAVPVPAAAWLFLSALAGIGGLKRSRK